MCIKQTMAVARDDGARCPLCRTLIRSVLQDI
jgi:hypothetical protein